ncbi:MAG TPA: NAD(P)-dependent oxidoreductase [Burkholderiaceae bacterium]|nr:NAD(P)-dependent oxidoreductase [Burkholderiaceae bacterium]
MRRIAPLYPLFADLTGRRVLVVGGGVVAERKVRSLMDCGATVHVGAPALTPLLKAWLNEGRLTHYDGAFRESWLAGVWLVIAATDVRSVNMRVKHAADARRILANVVDDPELSSFQVPSIVDRAPLTIAISSAGVAPVLARRVRERLEGLFDHTLAQLTQLAGDYRPAIRQAHPDARDRCRFYDWLLDGPVMAHLRNGSTRLAEQTLRDKLDAPHQGNAALLTLITARSDDPGFLTLRGLRALNEADAVATDSRLGERMVSMARRDADRHALLPEHLAHPDRCANALLALFPTYQRVTALIAADDLDETGLREVTDIIQRGGVLCSVVPGAPPTPA